MDSESKQISKRQKDISDIIFIFCMGTNYYIDICGTSIHLGKACAGWRFLWDLSAILRAIQKHKEPLKCNAEQVERIRDLILLCKYSSIVSWRVDKKNNSDEILLLKRNSWYQKQTQFGNWAEVTVPWLSEKIFLEWVKQLNFLASAGGGNDTACGLTNEMGEPIAFADFLEMVQERQRKPLWSNLTYLRQHGKDEPDPDDRKNVDFLIGSLVCLSHEDFC